MAGSIIAPPLPLNFLSIPMASATFYTGGMGDSFAAKGFAALSPRMRPRMLPASPARPSGQRARRLGFANNV